MATLTAADRSKMPAKDFAGPDKSFPVGDRTHARLAISGATRSEHAGNISESTEDSIKAKAREKLGEGGGMDHKAAVAKMHPHHVHKLVQDAHAGKFGPQAQQMAQSAMQPQGDDSMAPAAPASSGKSSMFSSGSGPAPAPAAPPAGRASMFGSGR